MASSTSRSGVRTAGTSVRAENCDWPPGRRRNTTSEHEDRFRLDRDGRVAPPQQVRVAPVRRRGQALDAIAPRVRTVADGDEVLPGVHVVALPGHTPGQLGFTVTGDHSRLLAFADVMHSPLQVQKPDWAVLGEPDPAASGTTRRRVLEDLTEEGTIGFGIHFADVPFGTVRMVSGCLTTRSNKVHACSAVSPGPAPLMLGHQAAGAEHADTVEISGDLDPAADALVRGRAGQAQQLRAAAGVVPGALEEPQVGADQRPDTRVQHPRDREVGLAAVVPRRLPVARLVRQVILVADPDGAAVGRPDERLVAPAAGGLDGGPDATTARAPSSASRSTPAWCSATLSRQRAASGTGSAASHAENGISGSTTSRGGRRDVLGQRRVERAGRRC